MLAFSNHYSGSRPRLQELPPRFCGEQFLLHAELPSLQRAIRAKVFCFRKSSAETGVILYLIKFFNQISRGSRGIFSAKALKIRLMQNLYAPYGAIKPLLCLPCAAATLGPEHLSTPGLRLPELFYGAVSESDWHDADGVSAEKWAIVIPVLRSCCPFRHKPNTPRPAPNRRASRITV